MVHAASEAFHRVLLYFEHSIGRPDWRLLPHAAAIARFDDSSGIVKSDLPIGIRHQGAAIVDGKLWPVYDGETVWLPAGEHQVTASEGAPERSVLSFTGELLDASFERESILLRYRSRSRAIARVNMRPEQILIDGKQFHSTVFDSKNSHAIMLPMGSHTARLSFGALVP